MFCCVIYFGLVTSYKYIDEGIYLSRRKRSVFWRIKNPAQVINIGWLSFLYNWKCIIPDLVYICQVLWGFIGCHLGSRCGIFQLSAPSHVPEQGSVHGRIPCLHWYTGLNLKQFMYYVYILQSQRNEKLYTGYSSNLKRRIAQHQRGEVHTTARMGEVKLIFYEAYINKEDARRREVYLKSTKGKRAIKLMLANTIGPVPCTRAKLGTWP